MVGESFCGERRENLSFVAQNETSPQFGGKLRDGPLVAREPYLFLPLSRCLLARTRVGVCCFVAFCHSSFARAGALEVRDCS